MKKVYIYILLVLVAFTVVACSAAPAEQTNPFVYRFDYYPVDKTTTVIVDDETGVCYLWRQVGYGAGLIVMVEPDGSPLIYREDIP